MEVVVLLQDHRKEIHDLYYLCDEDFVLPFSERETSAGDMMDKVFGSGEYSGIRLEDSLIACCGLRIIDGNAAQLHGLVVHPEHRGKGLGILLLGHIIDSAREKGVHTLHAGSWEGSHTLKILDDLDFIEVQRYADPGERPEGVRTVKLMKDLNQ